MRIAYKPWKPKAAALTVVEQANAIIAEYQEAGYTLTVRQLHYQFVARDLAPNTAHQYNRLKDIVSRGRLAGMIDWEAIEDRTRKTDIPTRWESPQEILTVCAQQFHVDMWTEHPCRVEVWCEKEALAGIFEGVCKELDVPYLSCRGYVSQSEMWRCARRMNRNSEGGQGTVLLHFGDHDASGLDMTRDIRDRLDTFGVDGVSVRRVALNMDQIDEFNPPPNFAKSSDPRFSEYQQEFGDESWEIDALDPSELARLVVREVQEHQDPLLWQRATRRKSEGRADLDQVASQWTDVIEWLNE